MSDKKEVQPVIDPRVALAGGGDRWRTAVRGVRCVKCRYPAADPLPRCPVCGEDVEDTAFGPYGTVWSSTVVRVGIPGRKPPYGIAYVDLDDGPRVTVHVENADEAIEVGARVRLRGTNSTGDVEVEEVTP